MYMYMYIAIGGWKLWSSASDIGRNPLSVWDILPDVTLSFMTLSSSYITLQISFKCPFSCWTVIYPTTISLPTHELISHSMSLSHALIQVAELPLKHVIWATYGFIALLLELNLSSFALMQMVTFWHRWWISQWGDMCWWTLYWQTRKDWLEVWRLGTDLAAVTRRSQSLGSCMEEVG